MKEIINLRGPSYIRIGKKGEPNLFDHDKVTQIGKAEIIKDGNDFLIVGIGPILSEALKASEYLANHHSISTCIASLGSISPLDISFLEEMKKRNFKHWFTLEEHGLKGGLGSEVNNWIIHSNELGNIKIKNICTPKEFIHKLGNQSYVRDVLKLNSKGIVEIILNQ